MPLKIAYYASYYGLWVLAPLMQAALAVIMVRRGLRRKFPFFFAYTVFQVIAFGLKFFFYHRSQLEYFYVYWTTGALSIVLAFAVIYEVFQHVFRPYAALRDMGAMLFRWAALVLLGIAALMTLTMPQMETSRVLQAILALERSVRVTQCGLVLFLFLFSPFLGISSRHHMFGIALGFGIFSSVDLILVTLLAQGLPVAPYFSLVKSAAYNVTVLVWSWYLLSPEPARRLARFPVADRWNFALAGVLHPEGETSFLPSIEHTVDRVFAKSNGKGNGHGNGHGNGNGDGAGNGQH